MLSARWRCLRILGMEGSALDREMRKSTAADGDKCARAFSALQSIGGAEGVPSEGLLRRYEAHYERQFSRAFHLLVKFRQLSGINGPIFAVRPAANLTGPAEPENTPPIPPPPPQPPTESSTSPAAGSPGPSADQPPPSSTPQTPQCRQNRHKRRTARRREAAILKQRREPNPEIGHLRSRA